MIYLDESTHTYTVDGKIIRPSVTEALASVGIIEYARVDQDVLDWKADFGDKGHKATAFLDRGELDEESLDPLLVPSVEAWKQFKLDTGLVVNLVEHHVLININGMVSVGTLDCTVVMNLQPWILEKKFTAKEERGWGPQTAAYELGLPKPTIPPYRYKRGAVRLCPGETPPYRLYKYDDPNDAQVFLAALKIATWKENHGSNR